jgi:hypothetical protein
MPKKRFTEEQISRVAAIVISVTRGVLPPDMSAVIRR